MKPGTALCALLQAWTLESPAMVGIVRAFEEERDLTSEEADQVAADIMFAAQVVGEMPSDQEMN